MHRWVAAFPNPNNADRDATEVIYEDWGEYWGTHYYMLQLQPGCHFEEDFQC